MFQTCDGVMDKAGEKWEETYEKVQGVADTFQATLVEQIGGKIDRNCKLDCFQVFALGAKASTRNEHIPSDTVMASVKVAMGILIRSDPMAGDMPFLGANGFTEVPVELRNGNPAKMWYLNDRQGMKYFSCAHLSGTQRDPRGAAGIADNVWRAPNFRHLFCSDDAPDIVCSNLGGRARMDYLVMPAPHVLSSVTARGIQWDEREAIVLSNRETFPLKIGEQSVDAHMLWMKSITHPKFSDGADGADAAGPMKTSKGIFESTLSPDDVADKPRKGNGRQLIKVRGLLLFDLPDGSDTTCTILFGHEDPLGLFNQVGRLAYYVGLGGKMPGGADQLVSHTLDRLLNVSGPRS